MAERAAVSMALIAVHDRVQVSRGGWAGFGSRVLAWARSRCWRISALGLGAVPGPERAQDRRVLLPCLRRGRATVDGHSARTRCTCCCMSREQARQPRVAACTRERRRGTPRWRGASARGAARPPAALGGHQVLERRQLLGPRCARRRCRALMHSSGSRIWVDLEDVGHARLGDEAPALRDHLDPAPRPRAGGNASRTGVRERP